MERKRVRVKLKLIGEDGNAYAILGKVRKQMKQEGWTKEEIKEYMDKATSGDYDNLLRVTMEYADVS